jgi:hypothetical protein
LINNISILIEKIFYWPHSTGEYSFLSHFFFVLLLVLDVASIGPQTDPSHKDTYHLNQTYCIYGVASKRT